MATLHRKKVALLHVARRDLALSEDDYRAVLQQQAGVSSAKHLDELGFHKVMQYLSKLGFKSSATRRNYGDRNGMATPAQIDFVRTLWSHYHGKDDGDRALNAWLSRFHRVSHLRFLTDDKVNRPGFAGGSNF